jgi:uncharacterized membrane protein YecN with MAPEG domain
MIEIEVTKKEVMTILVWILGITVLTTAILAWWGVHNPIPYRITSGCSLFVLGTMFYFEYITKDPA